MSTITRHGCSYYCRGTEHCELIYTSIPHDYCDDPARAAALVVREAGSAYRRRYGVRLTRAEPAREAPPADALNPNCAVQLMGNGIAEHAWLIWWED